MLWKAENCFNAQCASSDPRARDALDDEALSYSFGSLVPTSISEEGKRLHEMRALWLEQP